MPSITENLGLWGSQRAWSQDGDEWSEFWGTARAQWFGCLLPRVFPFLHGRILEIAPGHGRWTQFLTGHCESLIGIDLAPACVSRCIDRFAQLPHVNFCVNDGSSFPMIGSGTIDFAFSFDSLVHAEADVMESYVKELARVLKPGGVAFLHHSNLAAIPFRPLLERLKFRIPTLPVQFHWRAPSMSAEKMRPMVKRANMSCLQQEIIPWGTGWPIMIDCMTTIINTPGKQGPVVRNPRFMQEAAAIKRISALLQPAS